ncbi:CBN-DHS-20 protein [Aphelenchoides avenae]|nr:CBN-DHS-20 protein [Aphelenchus avenae]
MVWTLAAAPVGFGIILFVYQILRFLLDQVRIRDVTKKAVLITGCDSGFGLELALKCHQEGMLVFAGCYTEEGIAQLRKANKSSNRLRAFSLDICNEGSIEEAKKFVEKELLTDNRDLDYLVNNAGWGRVGYDDWIKPDEYSTSIDVNAMGMIRVTHAFKRLIKKSKGRIINMTSIYGRVSVPGYGPYIVSKFAAEGYSDVLRLEMRRFGVKVITIAPGYFRTRITEVGITSGMDITWNGAPQEVRDEYGDKFFKDVQRGVRKLLETTPNGSHVEWVVDAYFNAMTSIFPRQRYLVGYDAKYFWLPLMLVPTFVSDFIVEQMCAYYAK